MAATAGKGGDIVFKADKNMRTLMDFRYKRKYEAQNGQDGMKKKRYGKNGEDLIIKVPVGTMIIDEATGHVMGDLTEPDQSFIAAKGGKGGKGNVKYATSTETGSQLRRSQEVQPENERLCWR